MMPSRTSSAGARASSALSVDRSSVSVRSPQKMGMCRPFSRWYRIASMEVSTIITCTPLFTGRKHTIYDTKKKKTLPQGLVCIANIQCTSVRLGVTLECMCSRVAPSAATRNTQTDGQKDTNGRGSGACRNVMIALFQLRLQLQLTHNLEPRMNKTRRGGRQHQLGAAVVDTMCAADAVFAPSKATRTVSGGAQKYESVFQTNFAYKAWWFSCARPFACARPTRVPEI